MGLDYKRIRKPKLTNKAPIVALARALFLVLCLYWDLSIRPLLLHLSNEHPFNDVCILDMHMHWFACCGNSGSQKKMRSPE